jgi:hypothetical protein
VKSRLVLAMRRAFGKRGMSVVEGEMGGLQLTMRTYFNDRSLQFTCAAWWLVIYPGVLACPGLSKYVSV